MDVPEKKMIALILNILALNDFPEFLYVNNNIY